eukprot:7356181-Lingulodinium_polyedra.AAC.1
MDFKSNTTEPEPPNPAGHDLVDAERRKSQSTNLLHEAVDWVLGRDQLPRLFFVLRPLLGNSANGPAGHARRS